MFGSLRELRDVASDHGLGAAYYLLTGGVATVLMIVLFIWGHVDNDGATNPNIPPAAMSVPAAPTP